jgi:NADH-quinone oxidoreductase subunit E
VTDLVSADGAAPAPAELLAQPLPDDTMRELRELAGRYPQARSALLPMLHLVQSVEGFVTPRGIEACAAILGLAPAEVSAVSTFYTMYKRRPVGDYHVGVCTNTLCAIMGGDAILERLEEHLGIGNDETTPDGRVSLEHVECNAACDYAPVVMVNWEFFDNQTPQSATELVDRLRAGDEVTATRGARLCTWRQAERVLAGFTDDRADEGPVGGPATLVGLQLARRNDWTAPASQASGSAPTHESALHAAQDSDTQRAETESVVDAATPAGDQASDGDGHPKEKP